MRLTFTYIARVRVVDDVLDFIAAGRCCLSGATRIRTGRAEGETEDDVDEGASVATDLRMSRARFAWDYEIAFVRVCRSVASFLRFLPRTSQSDRVVAWRLPESA